MRQHIKILAITAGLASAATLTTGCASTTAPVAAAVMSHSSPMTAGTAVSPSAAPSTVAHRSSTVGATGGTTATTGSTSPATATTGSTSPSTTGPTSPTPTAGGGDHRPNIVMIMADDMRSDDLRFAPTVRRLIGARGVEFKNSFSPYPLCCPARASFLSGMYAHNHHVFAVTEPYGFGSFDDSYTVATALHDGGYNTGFVGKYLNHYGVDPSLVTGQPSWDYVPAGWTDWEGAVQRAPGSPATGGTYNYFNTSYNINGHVDNGYRGIYQTNTLGQMTRALVSKYHRQNKPFFIYMSALAPHHGAPGEADDPRHVRKLDGTYERLVTPARPGWVKGRFDRQVTRAPGLPIGGGSPEADMSDKPGYLRRLPDLSPQERQALVNVTRQRAESIYVLDRQVRKVIRRLKRTGEYKNTVIMFTSDNGYFLGEHRIREGKTKPHEPSLRVPFLIAGPGIPKGQNRYDPIMTPDITATITDLGNVSHLMAAHRTPDGSSKLPAIRRGDRGWTAPVVTEAMLRHPFERVKNVRLGFADARDEIGIRTARYKFVRYASGAVELYDLNRDPNELHSVQKDPAYHQVRRGLARLWWRYKDCKGDACRAPLPGRFQAGPRTERADTLLEIAGRKARNGYAY